MVKIFRWGYVMPAYHIIVVTCYSENMYAGAECTERPKKIQNGSTYRSTTPMLRRFVTHVSDLVVLGESVVVEDGEDERLVEGLAVGHPFEGERLVEERVQRLAVHFGLELALLVRH